MEGRGQGDKETRGQGDKGKKEFAMPHAPCPMPL